MRKKALVLVIFVFVCAILVIFSYLAWKERLDSVARPVERVQTTVEDPSETASEDPVEDASEVDASFTASLANMDDEVRSVFENRKAAGEKIQLLILASDLVDMGSPSMSERVEQQLQATYGDALEITKQTFNENSITITEQKLISFDGGYDVVLFEPFTLKNNGEVDIETEHAHITSIVERFRSEVEDVAIVFTPPNPIYNASYYPVQVEALLTFLNEQGYPVIEHWQNWPDPKDEQIREYLDENSRPNTEGAALWAQAVNSYLTGTTQ